MIFEIAKAVSSNALLQIIMHEEDGEGNAASAAFSHSFARCRSSFRKAHFASGAVQFVIPGIMSRQSSKEKN